MPQKGIYDHNRKKLVVDDNPERKIYNYLLKNKGKYVTQKKIGTALEISQATVSRSLKNLIGKTYTYRKKEYIIIQLENLYMMTHPQQIPGTFDKDALKKDSPFKSAFDLEVTNLSKPNILSGDYADLITNTVIFYEINSRYRTMVTTALMNLYSEQIHEILPCKRGLYIILKENEKTKFARSGILRLYNEAVNKK